MSEPHTRTTVTFDVAPHRAQIVYADLKAWLATRGLNVVGVEFAHPPTVMEEETGDPAVLRVEEEACPVCGATGKQDCVDRDGLVVEDHDQRAS